MCMYVKAHTFLLEAAAAAATEQDKALDTVSFAYLQSLNVCIYKCACA